MMGLPPLLAESGGLVEAIWVMLEPHLYWLGPCLAVLCVIWGYREGAKRRQLQGLPTSKVKGVFIGFVELEGILICEKPITSYLTESACAYHRFTVEEEWRKTVSYTDSDGKRRTRTESGWTTLLSGENMTVFDLEDETGRIQVWPRGAEIDALLTLSVTTGRGHHLYYSKGPPHSIPNSTGTRRFTEYQLPLQHRLFLVGQSRERTDRVEPEIAHHQDAPRYLISVRKEEQIISGHGWKEFAALFLGALLGVGLPAWQVLGTEHQVFEPLLLWAYGGVYLLVIVLSGTIGIYNSLIDIHQRVKQGLSLVDVQLKRRHDLLGNLIPMVTAMQTHEAKLQEVLVELRNEYQNAGRGVGRKMLALAEAYPTLKSSQNFLKLQKELIDTEDRISLAREYYVTITNNFAVLCERFPNSIIGGMARFSAPVPLEFLPEERQTPTVQFDQDPLT